MDKSRSPVQWLDTTMQEFLLQFSISVSISISCFSICPVQLAVAKQAIRPASKYILAMYGGTIVSSEIAMHDNRSPLQLLEWLPENWSKCFPERIRRNYERQYSAGICLLWWTPCCSCSWRGTFKRLRMLRTALKIAIPTTMSQRSGYGHPRVKDVLLRAKPEEVHH